MTTTLYILRLLFVLLLAPYVLSQSAPSARILIYSATQRFRHDSIPTAINALKAIGPQSNIQFDNTEDQSKFNDANLAQYDAILFLSTTGEVLDDAGKRAFQKYLDSGGNFVGIHSASDTLVNTTFYGRELGAYFDYHPALQNATVDVVDASHPSTNMLPAAWQVQDEMYNFKSDPRAIGATVVLAANESSYVDDGPRKFDQGSPHPIAWFQTRGAGVDNGGIAGRSFYTSLGHLNETWKDNLFLSHVIGGITWVLQSNTTKAMNSSATVGNSEGTGSSTSSSTRSLSPSSASGGTSPSSSSVDRATLTHVSAILATLAAGLVVVAFYWLMGSGHFGL